MKRTLWAIVTAGVVLGGAGAAEQAAAQSAIPFSVEVRADAAFPTGDAFADRADTGVGFGVSASVQLIPNIGIYGGYSRTTFDLDAPANARAVDSGFAVGLTTALPGVGRAITPWVGGGLLIHDLELEGVTPAVAGDGQLGFEVGGGVALALSPHLRLTPGVGYRRYEARFLADEREPISYFTAGVGLNLAF